MALASANKDVPLAVNFDRFLESEKKQFVLDFAKVKLSKVNVAGRIDEFEACFSDSLEYKVFEAMVEVCEAQT